MSTVTMGRKLEVAIAEFLATRGYSTWRNEVLVGRSGVAHEVDVLAEKRDGLLTFRVMVECKNWRGQADKSVIAKAAHVAADLGLSKVIVASVGGCEPGARQVATDLGVEIWGPEEIAAHLGTVSLRELRDAGAATTQACGYAVSVAEAAGFGLIEREARGTFGLGGEAIVRQALVWLPGFIHTIGVARLEGRIKKTVREHTVWARYEAMSGALAARTLSAPSLEPVTVANALLPAAVTSREIEQKIRKAAARLVEVRQQHARANHASTLQRLGVLDERAAKAESAVGACFRSAEINGTEHIVRPFYVAIAERKTQRRVIAVDGHDGRLSPAMGRILTGQVTHIDDALITYEASLL